MRSRIFLYLGLVVALTAAVMVPGAAQTCCPDFRGNCLSVALNSDGGGDELPSGPPCDLAAMQGCCRASTDVVRPAIAVLDMLHPPLRYYDPIALPIAGSEIEPATPPPRAARPDTELFNQLKSSKIEE